jgi:hypothetical protein
MHTYRGKTFPRAILFPLLMLWSTAAFAQPEEPIGRFTADIRGSFARHKQEPSVATDLGVLSGNLPTRSLGLSGGAHWYPARLGVITFGLGGHLVWTRGSETPETTATSTTPGTGTTPPPPNASSTVVRHFRVWAPDVSFNFGHRNGWSYISGGLGRSNLFVELKEQPVANPPGRQTIHYGAGARWFTTHHIAVSLDLRWYSVAEQAASATGGVAQPHTTLLLLCGGIALR